MSSKQIKITIDEDGIWGDSDMTGIDAKASVAKLEQMVADKVGEFYPEYDVEVDTGSTGKTKVNIYGEDEPTDEDEEVINQITSDVYGEWSWVIEKDDE